MKAEPPYPYIYLERAGRTIRDPERKLPRRSYGTITLRDVPVEVCRTERPVRRFIRRFFARGGAGT